MKQRVPERRTAALWFRDIIHHFLDIITSQYANIILDRYFAFCEALSCASHQPEENPGRQQGAPGMGGVLIGLVQGGQECRLGAFPGCKAKLEKLGQSWSLRCFRHQPQQVPVSCLDQLQRQEGFHSVRSEPCRLRQGEMER